MRHLVRASAGPPRPRGPWPGSASPGGRASALAYADTVKPAEALVPADAVELPAVPEAAPVNVPAAPIVPPPAVMLPAPTVEARRRWSRRRCTSRRARSSRPRSTPAGLPPSRWCTRPRSSRPRPAGARQQAPRPARVPDPHQPRPGRRRPEHRRQQLLPAGHPRPTGRDQRGALGAGPRHRHRRPGVPDAVDRPGHRHPLGRPLAWLPRFGVEDVTASSRWPPPCWWRCTSGCCSSTLRPAAGRRLRRPVHR